MKTLLAFFINWGARGQDRPEPFYPYRAVDDFHSGQEFLFAGKVYYRDNHYVFLVKGVILEDLELARPTRNVVSMYPILSRHDTSHGSFVISVVEYRVCC